MTTIPDNHCRICHTNRGVCCYRCPPPTGREAREAATEAHIAAELTEAANEIEPSPDALQRIRERSRPLYRGGPVIRRDRDD